MLKCQYVNVIMGIIVKICKFCIIEEYYRLKIKK